MADSQNTIPYGLCQCGCGRETNPAKYNSEKYGWTKGEPVRFVQGHYTRVINQLGANNASWKGGQTKRRGYLLISMPEHPRAVNGYVRGYHMVAEKALGHYLPNGAVVHHHTPTDLVICENQTYHMLIHQRTRAWEACGDADWLKCQYCKQYDDPKRLYLIGKQHFHQACQREYERNRRHKKIIHRAGSTNTSSSTS